VVRRREKVRRRDFWKGVAMALARMLHVDEHVMGYGAKTKLLSIADFKLVHG
jgi:hypothetical protein